MPGALKRLTSIHSWKNHEGILYCIILFKQKRHTGNRQVQVGFFCLLNVIPKDKYTWNNMWSCINKLVTWISYTRLQVHLIMNIRKQMHTNPYTVLLFPYTDHKEHNIFDILYVLGCVKNVFETVNSVLSIIYLPFILWFESKYCTDLAKALD